MPKLASSPLKYPVVLVHGIAATGELNFRNVREEFWSRNIPTLAPSLSTYNSSKVRGTQLYGDIRAFMEDTGAEKVHVIAHSQGGLDTRSMIADYGHEFLATVTTLATPHMGSPVADFFSKTTPDFALDAGLHISGLFYGSQRPNDGSAVVHYLSSEAMARVNAEVPIPTDLPFFSIAGAPDLHVADRKMCRGSLLPIPERSGVSATVLPTMLLLRATGTSGNDGIVPTASAGHVGEFLGCVDADHLTQAGLGGLVVGAQPAYDQVDFFVEYIGFLQTKESRL